MVLNTGGIFLCHLSDILIQLFLLKETRQQSPFGSSFQLDSECNKQIQNPISKILGKSSRGVSGPSSAELATGKITACPRLMPRHPTCVFQGKEGSREVKWKGVMGWAPLRERLGTGQSWAYEVKEP